MKTLTFLWWFALFVAFAVWRIDCEPPPSEYKVITSEGEWDINHQKGVMKGQNLRMSKIEHPTNKFHTCYRAVCSGTHCVEHGRGEVREFCYPAVIITGLPKCGTSAVYDLLAKVPGAVTMHEKENCPYTRRRAHYMYFYSLPALNQVHENSFIIDGCLDSTYNMKMRELLHNPDTYYLVMIRDYADMLWSSYNFWCKVPYDPAGCNFEKWTIPGVHVRSPAIFHDLIIADRDSNMSVVQPFHYPMQRPCHNAGGYYSEFIDFTLKSVPRNKIVIVSSEEMDIAPMKVVRSIVHKINVTVNWEQFSLGNFSKVRINAQSNKGSSRSTNLMQYQPGVYNISGFQPMFAKTREVLDRCWNADCLEMAKRTGFKYKACHPHLVGKQSLYDRSLARVETFMKEHTHDISQLSDEHLRQGETLVHDMMQAHALDRLHVNPMQLTAGL